jgi:hypothetical protein
VHLNLPRLTSIEDYGLYECYKLVGLDAPLLKKVGYCGFSQCSKLKAVRAPKMRRRDFSCSESYCGVCPVCQDTMYICLQNQNYFSIIELRQ